MRLRATRLGRGTVQSRVQFAMSDTVELKIDQGHALPLVSQPLPVSAEWRH